MRYVIQCPCGASVVADDPESLIDQVCAHAMEAHGMTLTREQAEEMLALIAGEPPGRERRSRAQPRQAR